MCKKLVVLVLVLAVASVASAGYQDVLYTGGGAAGVWTDNANWSVAGGTLAAGPGSVYTATVPGDLANPKIDGALGTMTLPSTVNILNGTYNHAGYVSFGKSAASSATLNGASGRTVWNEGMNLSIGNGFLANVTMKDMDITLYEGGTYRQFVINNKAVANCSAVLDNCTVRADRFNVSATAGVAAFLTLQGGTVAKLDAFSFRTGIVDIKDTSEMWVAGDQTGAGSTYNLNQFIGNATASFYGDGIDDGVSVVYHTTGEAAGYTVVSVPEPATIAMLGFGGLALIRKRR